MYVEYISALKVKYHAKRITFTCNKMGTIDLFNHLKVETKAKVIHSEFIIQRMFSNYFVLCFVSKR